ncbi:MAG: hypothetical protein MK240_10300 [Opitutales bacterium]|nr:hypothetical protein [Opitutales bacterium]
MNNLIRISLNISAAVFIIVSTTPIAISGDHEKPIIEVRVYKIAVGKMDEWGRFFHD